MTPAEVKRLVHTLVSASLNNLATNVGRWGKIPQLAAVKNAADTAEVQGYMRGLAERLAAEVREKPPIDSTAKEVK